MRYWCLLTLLACLACADRSAPAPEFRLTAEQMCEAYCERADICWHDEVAPNPFAGDVDGCIADCISLDAAWETDPLGRDHCTDLIYDMRACSISYDQCEAFDDAQIPGQGGADGRCAAEIQAVLSDCAAPDPRNDP